MDNGNFGGWCKTLDGRYDEKYNACTLTNDSYRKLQEIQKELMEGAMQKRVESNLRDINSGRGTNLDSFNSYDEVFGKDGTVLIRRPNIVNIYDSSVTLYK